MFSDFSHVQVSATLWTVTCQAPLSMGFSSKTTKEWVAIHSSRDLPDPGIEPVSPAAPALQEDSLPPSHWVSSRRFICA